MDEPITSGQASDWARLAAEQMERALPDLVVSTMAKTAHRRKVLLDWSQNNASKTTIAPYSLRGRPRPTVAAPRSWDEITPSVGHLELSEVLHRVAGGLDPMTALLEQPTRLEGTSPLAPAVKVTAVRERRSPARPVVVGGGHRPRPTGMVMPAGLAGPVQVALARSSDQLPGPKALPGGSRYEPKYDGFRTTVVGGTGGVRLWSKSGTDFTARFSEIARAAGDMVPDGCVLDGEMVIWLGDRLRFELLQRRLTTARPKLAEEARTHPASYMVFDLLAVEGRDLRGYPWRTRRALLEQLARGWTPPLQLSPVTDDDELARRWMVEYRPTGIEGLVVKGADSRYEPNSRRSWIKVKPRESTEVVVGAVVGPMTAPTAFVAGLYDQAGTLRMVGRSTTLSRAQSRALAAVLTAVAVDHPWPDSIAATRFGGTRDRIALTRVEPTVIVEVAADAAREYGVWRHGLRSIRLRADLTVSDLAVLDAHGDTA